MSPVAEQGLHDESVGISDGRFDLPLQTVCCRVGQPVLDGKECRYAVLLAPADRFVQRRKFAKRLPARPWEAGSDDRRLPKEAVPI